MSKYAVTVVTAVAISGYSKPFTTKKDAEKYAAAVAKELRKAWWVIGTQKDGHYACYIPDRGPKDGFDWSVLVEIIAL